jgi:hypothetical protein
MGVNILMCLTVYAKSGNKALTCTLYYVIKKSINTVYKTYPNNIIHATDCIEV